MALPSASPGDADAASPIALERTGLGPAPPAFWLATAAVAAAALAFLLLHDPGPDAARAGEAATLDGPWPWGALSLSLAGGRALAAVSVPLALVATGLAARRLLHSDMAGLLAVGLVALDPAVLATGSAAHPAATLLALGMGALAAFCSPRPAVHWLGGLQLAALALLDPGALLWCLPLAMLVLLRGHVYAAPTHLAQALVQCGLLPAAAGLAGIAARASSGDSLGDCLHPPHLASLALARIQDLGGGLVAFPNPVTWIAGAGALLAIGLTALGGVALRFRMQRLPGRLQFRLPDPLPPAQGRALWILLLALTVPHPLLAVPLLAIGLAAGIAALGDDAPGFGTALAAASLVFAVSFLARAWPLATGTATPEQVADIGHVIPWATVSAC